MKIPFLKRSAEDSKKHLKTLLGNFELPSFPNIVVETLKVLRDEDSSSTEVADILSGDPGLTLKILKSANSSYFSPVQKIENLTQAVALMGTSSLETLILSIAVSDISPHAECPGFDFGRFWHTSALRACVARSISEQIHPSENSVCFTAGLLQDMAVPFVAEKIPSKYGPILEKWHNTGQDLAKLEREIFDWDHAELGALVATSWDIPENIISAIGESHGTVDMGGHIPISVQLVGQIRESEQESDLEKIIQYIHKRYEIPLDKLNEEIEKSKKQAEDLTSKMI